MRRVGAALVALLLGTTLAACGGFATGEETDSTPARPVTATRLPDVTLQGLRSADRPVALRDIKGPTVINLWAQWCNECKPELPYYEQFHRSHPQVEVLGIDWQETQPDRARSLARQKGLTYPLVTDPDRRIAGRGLPQLIMIDARGKIAYQQYTVITSTAQLESLVREHLGVDL